jgi:flagellar biogenesis protein FliO
MQLSPGAKREIVEFAQAFGAMLVVVAFVLACVWVAR